MTVKTAAELKARFETNDQPTGQDFIDLIDSLLHKNLDNFPNPLPAVSGAALTNLGLTVALADGAVTTQKLADAAVVAAKLAALAVLTTKLADAAVTAPKLADLAVTAAKLADLSITAVKLANGAVTADKLAALAATTAKLADLSVTAAKLAALAVTTAKLAALAVTSDKLADGAVLTSKIAALAVDASKLAAGAIGADKIAASAVSTDKIANSAVSQPKLKTATAASIVNIAANTSAAYLLVGGEYSWWNGSADNGAENKGLVFGAGAVSPGYMGIRNSNSSAINVYANERYIQASPPYNLGNGDIPQFIFVQLDALGNILSCHVAQDPPWAYHGPTNIATERIGKDGKPYRRYATLAGKPLDEALKDVATREQFLNGEIEPTVSEIEITHEIKNKDMALFPHPLVGNPVTGTMIMLDPLSPLVDRLSLIHHELGAQAVRDLIVVGDVIIDNTPLTGKTPPGVIMTGGRRKLTSPKPPAPRRPPV